MEPARGSGDCEGSEDMWYYNTGSRTCEQFQYSGCDGNENRFSSRFECQEECFVPGDYCQETGNCTKACMFGVKTDRNGCPQCECAEDPCKASLENYQSGIVFQNNAEGEIRMAFYAQVKHISYSAIVVNQFKIEVSLQFQTIGCEDESMCLHNRTMVGSMEVVEPQCISKYMWDTNNQRVQAATDTPT